VVFLVDQLKFAVSVDAAKQLIPDTLSKESLAKTDSNVTALLTSVCKKLDQTKLAEFETEVIRNFLLAASSEAN